ncbi:unnamed protein product, partial [Oppiella nova]
HHSSRQSAQGFCVFADISLIMQYLWQHLDDSLKFMIIDLDAHQGNGYEKDLFIFTQNQRQNVYVLDVYNKDIYPRDEFAKAFINRGVELLSNTSDEEYLKLLNKNIEKAFQEFTPNLVIYNAGTDILSGDPLGGLNISRDGVLERDVIVFQMAKDNDIPIVMLTSGGYQLSNARIIADSIINLMDKQIINSVVERKDSYRQTIGCIGVYMSAQRGLQITGGQILSAYASRSSYRDARLVVTTAGQ